ncbi:WG repeat-containing protein [Achromobacter deleyi]|uniref:WG repeat-containing protein n=1 Tax=Achromobacter deleyi TaxID=1353891 RepID=UPI001492A6E8|nr:WG repeat-containing protein [Achromobacter deleyi]QVQ25952.1 WG repeat-containing protein [Achromobacter deleyi]UIP21493.1 WG repeat-containing protein [Achromobacter deleyi]
MRAARAFKPLALAVALTGLPLASGAAQAMPDWMRQCAASYYAQGADSYCHQAYQEGLAAVLTGSASDESGAWGYIDKHGRMAITPAYSDARPFQNGLAAVSQGELWGYIDTKGQWAIKPRFANATGFNAEGTALAEEDGRDVLIDRHGKVIKTFPLGTRTWGFQPGQKLASMEVPTPPRLFNTATGKAATLPEGVMALAAPTGGYLPAQSRDTRYGGWWGLLDNGGNWAILPQVLRSMEAPMRDGDVVAVRRERLWEFVNTQGESVSQDRYERVQLLTPGMWLVKPQAGNSALLDGKLKTVHEFPVEYLGLQERDGWRYAAVPGMTLLIGPTGEARLLPLRSGNVEINRGQAWVYGAHVSATGTPVGDAMDAAADAMGAAEEAEAAPETAEAATDVAAGMEAQADAAADIAAPVSGADAAHAAAADATTLAAMDADAAPDGAAQDTSIAPSDEGTLFQIYTHDGRPVLEDATVARLRDYQIDALNPGTKADPRGADAPLALLRPNDYQQPLGILTADGKIVTNPDWENIETYDVTMPLVVRTRDGGAGAIGADGTWVVPPRFTNIRAFSGPYTWARAASTKRDDALLIDTRGKTVSIPADVVKEASKLDGELLFYRAQDENRQRRWGIWNIRKGAPALKPAYDRIEEFEDDWARVEDKGRWGVVNREGKWVIPATHAGSYDMEYLGNGLMLIDDPEAKRKRPGYSDSAYRLVNLHTGKSSEPIIGKPDKLKDGRFLGELADASIVLFDAQGGAVRVSDGRPESKEQYGDWLYVKHDEREGAIDARGNMKVPAIYGEFNPFFAQPEGLARANVGSGYRVIDQNGRAVLEKLGDGTPLASMRRIVFGDEKNSASIMTDLQGREIARIAGRYAVDERNASEGVVPYSDEKGKYGFIDAAGKRVVGAHFDQLGALKNGLAKARRLERTGKLYGYVDLTGRYAIAPAFIWADDFREERAMVRRDRLVEFIDTKGKTTALFGVLCDSIVIVDEQDRQSWPPQKLTCPEAVELEPPVPDNAKAE